MSDGVPLTFDHMFNIYLNPEFIKSLSGKGKQWLSRAMVNMLVVDKSIHHSELSYLEDAIGMAETEEEREELKKAVKEHNQLELGNLDTDRDYAGHFFYYLAMNVAATENQEIRSRLPASTLRQTGLSPQFCKTGTALVGRTGETVS